MNPTGLSRHQLPSLTALQCFEAAARHLNFTLAAKELHLTQSAVSKQVAQLESLLQTQLFSRHRKQLTLSSTGTRYLAHAQSILRASEHATLDILWHDHNTKPLVIGAHPTLATYWLIPYLKDFYQSHPHIQLHFVDVLQPNEQTHTYCDVNFLFGHGNWEGLKAVKLFDEGMVAVGSPDLIQHTPIQHASDLSQLTLVHCSSRPSAWHDYFEAQNIDTTFAYKGPRFDTWSACSQAATAGYGAALVPFFLVSSALKNQRLIQVWDYELASQDAYYLTYPAHEAQEPTVRQLVEWIKNNPRAPKHQS